MLTANKDFVPILFSFKLENFCVFVVHCRALTIVVFDKGVIHLSKHKSLTIIFIGMVISCTLLTAHDETVK